MLVGYFSLLFATLFRVALSRLTGGVLHHSYYLRLAEMPRPGTAGAVFHGDVYTTAYRRHNQLGCVSSGKFRRVFESWIEEDRCRYYECLPNNSTEREGTLIKRMHNCGPPGPEMVPFLCHYTVVPDPHTVPFPACCPQFRCLHDYDPRRLMLPEDSPTQSRAGNEVFSSAFSSPDQGHRGGSGSSPPPRNTSSSVATGAAAESDANTSTFSPLELAWQRAIEFVEFTDNQPISANDNAPPPPPPPHSPSLPPAVAARARDSHRGRAVVVRKRLIRVMPANIPLAVHDSERRESKKQQQQQQQQQQQREKAPTENQHPATETPAFSILDIVF